MMFLAVNNLPKTRSMKPVYEAVACPSLKRSFVSVLCSLVDNNEYSLERAFNRAVDC